ncbi:hypothetical protein ACIP8I_02960 [Pseudomonas sp. NPDC088414]|uniref:hypothetical protein n=1 Tax=Pseudomonas sp. NPDC088414 TaxID=3364454 RepID=UPI00381C9B00
MPDNILVYDAPQVRGIPESDPAGNIPPDLLQNGIEVIIPVWPQQSPPGEQDTLIVRLTRSGVVEFTSTTFYTTPITALEIIIPIGPEFLINDGVVELSYETQNFVGNPAYSDPRTLTINHTPVPVNLPAPDFPAANIWGYLNCSSNPPVWHGIEVKVPPLPAFCQIGDVCAVEWSGYSTLNGSGTVIPGTYKRIDKTLLSAQEIAVGFSITVEPFVPHIEPMKKDASGKAGYSIYRGFRLIGSSNSGVVKIDRIIPGENLPCGP